MAIMCGMSRVLSSNREMSTDEFKAWLRHFDSDKDGRISIEELKEALSSLGLWFGRWKAKQAMRSADCDHTGKIESGKEIEKLVLYAQQQLHMKIYDNES